MKTFAELLREYRGDRSQIKVASELDISPSYYSELERGLKEPSYRTLAQIILKSGMGKDYWIAPDSYYDEEPVGHSTAAKEASAYSGKFVKKPHDMKISEMIAWLSELRVYLETNSISLPTSDRYALYYTLDACLKALTLKQER